MRLSELVREWLDRAEQDASTAEFLLNMRPRPAEIIGFHAQQAVEKSLKAILTSANVTPPRTHDLVFLHQSCARQAGIDLDRILLCSRLTPYAVEHRYPVQSRVDEDQILSDLAQAVEFVHDIRDRLAGE